MFHLNGHTATPILNLRAFSDTVLAADIKQKSLVEKRCHWIFFLFDNCKISFWCVDTLLLIYLLIFFIPCGFCLPFCAAVHAFWSSAWSRHVSQHLTARETRVMCGAMQQIMHGQLNLVQYVKKMQLYSLNWHMLSLYRYKVDSENFSNASVCKCIDDIPNV